MTDLTIQSLKFQGKKAKAIYAYKATMNDELSFKVDDLITITQCSDDETWLEGTLNSRTGWFPSNYVSLIKEDQDVNNSFNKEDNLVNLKNDSSLCEINLTISNEQQKNDDDLRIKNINELKTSEETFLDEMCKFIKIALIPLQANNLNLNGTEIIPNNLIQILNNSLDEVISCHQNFYQHLKEIPLNKDAKIGFLFISMASQFKQAYDVYSKINPKFTNALNKNKEQIGKYFDLSAAFNKIKSPMLSNSNLNASIYISKYLTAPFKQLEFYSKTLREIHRFTEDFHVDRGDVQRSIEFYTELSINMQEIRRRKECELDIMSSQINNIDEDIFQNGESLFLSSVLIINESGDKKDRILILFPEYLVILSQNLNSTFEFVAKIPFIVNSQINIQIKKVNNIEIIDSIYSGKNGQSLIDSISDCKYCFELIVGVNTTRYLIVCSTSYDIKMWFDIISNQISKIQFALNNKSLNLIATKAKEQLPMVKSPLQNSSFKKTIKPKNTSINPGVRKHFTMRPHPALIPHFQLPADVTNNNLNNSIQLLSSNDLGQMKRFMYKKAKLSEPFGKYHGADDDLKLLNVIELFSKAKLRQSVSIQDSPNSSINQGKILSLQRSDTIDNKSNNKIADDKSKIEANVETLVAELSENKKSNKELKLMVSNLQKQLESERLSRRKLENFIKKQKVPTSSNNYNNNENTHHHVTTELPNISINFEHESSI